MSSKITVTEAVEKLVSLAKEVDIKDPINWDVVEVNQDHLYETMANSVIEQFSTVPEDFRETIMLATITKMLVENFVLNYNLKRKLERK